MGKIHLTPYNRGVHLLGVAPQKKVPGCRRRLAQKQGGLNSPKREGGATGGGLAYA